VESNGSALGGNYRYYREIVTLKDGTRFDTVLLDDQKIYACALADDGKLKMAPPQWESYIAYTASDCAYDESTIDMHRWPAVDISPVFRFYPFRNRQIFLGFEQSDPGYTQVLNTDQSQLTSKFARCESGARKYAELEKRKSADSSMAFEAGLKQKELEKRQAIEWEEQRQVKIAAEAVNVRKNIRIGTRTNCGLVFDVKQPMIGVQTMVGMQYIHVDELWGPSAGCYFRNGVYTGPNR
jgi:hypothetical protein